MDDSQLAFRGVIVNTLLGLKVAFDNHYERQK